ncbi:RtcB family protein [Aquifex sp.]
MGLKEKLIRRDKYIWELPAGTVEGQKVPVIVYISDALYQLLEDDALRQAANAASLPGVEKAIYVMPDVHVGYGFPVGGVMATNTKNGIISPGSVGYDINCLPEGAEILSEYGYRFKIEEYSGENLVGIKGNFEPRNAPVLILFKKRDRKLLKIRTYLGYEIALTPDHPVLTKERMKEARFLSKGDFVAIYPFKGVEYEKPEEFTIVESTGNAVHDEELKKRGLLPLSSNNEKLPILLRLIGYITGDGNLGKNRVNIWGSEEDLQRIKEDIKRLGFSACGVYKRSKKVKVNGKVYETRENYLYVPSKSLVSLLKTLGVPTGKKTESDFSVPNWIFKLPKWMKRLYLAGLFGAEMNKPQTSNGFNFINLSFSINKKKEFVESGRKFLEDIKKLLEEFGVKIQKIEEFPEGKSIRLRLSISMEEGNLLKFLENVGYEYSIKKSRLANLAAAYIRYKQKARNLRKEIAKKAKLLKAAGMDIQTIAEKLSINRRFVERSIYEAREDVRIGKDTLSFEEWAKHYTEGFIVWDEIEEIREEEYEGWVYDFSLNTEEHNFIAGNFVVSNCGVRLIATNLKAVDIAPKIKQIMNEILKNVPAGVGSTSDIKLSKSQMKEVLVKGAGWAVNYGFGFAEDLQHIEGFGALPNADPDKASKEAYERGSDELGTVGSGNHFVEIQAVEEIYDETAAEKLGLWEGQVTIMVHSGSRGFGHQVCTDYLKITLKAAKKYGIKLPDPQLACVPFSSPEGQDYFRAMNAAANYAFANRQILGFKTANTLRKFLGISWEEFGYRLIYDHAHNIAKVEKHKVGNKEVEVVVHRKGATRAFPPYNPEVPPAYRDIGQPVIIPGDMGRASYLLVGQPKSMEMSFGTACHGAGRVMSRRKAKQFVREHGFEKVLAGLVVVARGKGTIMEEIPQAYKDVSEVVRVIDELGIAKVVAKLKPLGTLKG